jgi:hypothetical protein
MNRRIVSKMAGTSYVPAHFDGWLKMNAWMTAARERPGAGADRPGLAQRGYATRRADPKTHRSINTARPGLLQLGCHSSTKAGGFQAWRRSGGTFDQPVDLRRAIHIWTRRKLPGVIIPDETEQFPGEPEWPSDFQAETSQAFPSVIWSKDSTRASAIWSIMASGRG